MTSHDETNFNIQCGDGKISLCNTTAGIPGATVSRSTVAAVYSGGAVLTVFRVTFSTVECSGKLRGLFLSASF